MRVKDAGRDTGLIPAHAGKTTPRSTRPGARWAHPRSRGENERRHLAVLSEAGSSPLARGKRRGDGARCRADGLIPAHAGKTLWSRRPTRTARAHPRSRGENKRYRSGTGPRQGSSPLTRGKQLVGALVLDGLGLIPAHAGKTCGPGSRRARLGAHPRSRGENPAACRS